MLETIDPYWIALMLVMTGGIAAIVIPYLGKILDDGVAFKVSYFVPLCITVLVGAIALIPDPVPDLVPQIMAQMFVMGYGLQSAGNFVTTRVIKK